MANSEITINPDKAFLRGLREIKVKDQGEVRDALRRILGVGTDQALRNYAGGKVKNLDVAKYTQIQDLFESYGVAQPWGL